MRTVAVVAAAIVFEGRIFAARRGPGGEAGLKWEFPGGKIEAGEEARAALAREIREELELDVEVGELLAESRHRGRELEISLSLYRARILSGILVLREHLEGRWLGAGELGELDWAPADRPFLGPLALLLAAPGGENGGA